MFRNSLFLMLASVAGVAAAQTQDPQAAAPVQYDNGPATQQAENTIMDCGLDDSGRPLACPNDAGYTPDDQIAPADDAPLFAPDYYAYEDYQYYPPYPYYAGVSLWPAYYWPGYAWGWGGWGWGWGFPAFSIGFGWGGGWHHGGWWHGGWHGGYAWNGGGARFHGPWRYDGNGHFSDNRRDFGRSANFAANRNINAERGFNRGYSTARGVDGMQSSSFRANQAGANTFNANRFGAGRGTLPSSSYYANSRGVNNAQSFNRGDVSTANRAQFGGANAVARGGAFNSRQYSATMRGPTSFNSRSYSATMQSPRTMSSRSYPSVQRGGYAPQQRSFAGYPGSRAGVYGRSGYRAARLTPAVMAATPRRMRARRFIRPAAVMAVATAVTTTDRRCMKRKGPQHAGLFFAKFFRRSVQMRSA